MSTAPHAVIRESLQKRIQTGEWALGGRIPDEIDLAEEYGCARSTVNRALQALANEGLLIRKRKGGTRVNPFPVRQAKFEIPIVREQVEATGNTYRHQVVHQQVKVPPSAVRTRLQLASDAKALLLETVHLASNRPFAFEIRWVNLGAVPGILDAPLDTISANEWLVKTMPFSTGSIAFAAVNADAKTANALEMDKDVAIFVIDRTTWLGDEFITTMKLYHKPGYHLYSQI